MMELVATLKGIAGCVISVGVIGGGALYIEDAHDDLDDRHAPMGKVMRMEAAGKVDTIQDWIRAARDEGASEYICDAIRAELIALCSEMPDHYLCSAQSQIDTLKRAGCE